MSISCGVKNCTHNDNEGNCYAKVVSVRGERAVVSDGTLCKSFADRSVISDVEFAEDFNASLRKANTNNIKCGAGACKYNHNRHCHANDVKINQATASCDTFMID